jgi:phosphatidylglycerophosphate synthase
VIHVLLSWIPNGLSLTRLVLGLVLPGLPAEYRLAVVGIAAATDLLDGLTARWLRAGSQTGRLLDPLADKVFVLVLVGTLVSEGAIGLAWAIAVAARDLTVMAAAMVAMARARLKDIRWMKPRWLGKCATAAQFVLLLIVVGAGGGWWWPTALTAGLSIAAAADYAVAYLRRPAGSPDSGTRE